MRRYELMLIIRPDVPDDRSQALSTGPPGRS